MYGTASMSVVRVKNRKPPFDENYMRRVLLRRFYVFSITSGWRLVTQIKGEEAKRENPAFSNFTDSFILPCWKERIFPKKQKSKTINLSYGSQPINSPISSD